VQTRESLEIPDVGCLPHPPLSALASGNARIAADMRAGTFDVCPPQTDTELVIWVRPGVQRLSR